MTPTRTKDDAIRIAADALGESLREHGGTLAVNGEPVATIEADAVSGHVTERPHDRPFVPPDDYFDESDFLESPELERIGAALIGRYPEFGFLLNADAKVAFVWKRKGGRSAGKAVYGKCQKPSGLLRFFSDQDFVVWLAADHVREADYTNLMLEALVYHECLHMGYEVDDTTGEMTLAMRAHDHELFWEELRRYGAWDQKRRKTGEVYAQVALTGGAS